MSMLYKPDSKVVLSIVNRHLPQYTRYCSVTSATDLYVFTFDKVELRLRLGDPDATCEVIDLYGQLGRNVIDPLRRDVRTAFKLPENHCDEYAVAVAVLQVLEIVSEFESFHDESRVKRAGKWDAREIRGWQPLLENPLGEDTSTVQDIAYRFIGKTPEQIAEEIPPEFRIVHIEPILRHDLAKRFVRYQNALRERLEELSGNVHLKSKIPPDSVFDGQVRAKIDTRDVIDELVRPRTSYHGTTAKAVPSVVRFGFKVPGELLNGKMIVSPRSGMVYCHGIYSSPAAFYALSYGQGHYTPTPIGALPSMRLIVCAVIMGRTLRPGQSNASVHGPAAEGYDSHFDGKFEYVVHNEHAILPCYIINLDLGSEIAKKAVADAQADPYGFDVASRQRRAQRNAEMRLNRSLLAPGDAKRERDMRKAAAMKWFPNGFGTARGTQFVIQEIGDNDDDEEDYGQWQVDRHAFGHDDDFTYDGNEVDHEGNAQNTLDYDRGSWLDEYQAARKAKSPKRN